MIESFINVIQNRTFWLFSIEYPVSTRLNQKRFRIVQYEIVFDSDVLKQDIGVFFCFSIDKYLCMVEDNIE